MNGGFWSTNADGSWNFDYIDHLTDEIIALSGYWPVARMTVASDEKRRQRVLHQG